MARGLKFWIYEEEGLYYLYLCSENKGADQLCGLCFRICRKPVFSQQGSYVLFMLGNFACFLSSDEAAD